MKITSKLGKEILSYVLMTLAVTLFCFSWEGFMIPNNFTGGGLTGLCTIIQYATNGAIPLSHSYIISNAVLIAISILIFGGRFGAKTLYCIVLSTVLFDVFSGWEAIQCIPGHFFYIPDRSLIPIIAGLGEGFSLYVILECGGSTGGSDILALIINKYWPVSPGKAFMYMDIIIIGSIILLPGKTFSDMMYGYIMMITFSVSLDFLMMGRQSSVQLLAFSEKYQEIADQILYRMDWGVTVIKATGWYTKSEKDVLLIILRKNQLRDVTKAIHHIDPRAFVSVTKANSVYGEGFDTIKTGIERKNKKKD